MPTSWPKACASSPPPVMSGRIEILPDPGITLLELFAYITETLIFRVNQITDDDRRAFARLLWSDAEACVTAAGAGGATRKRRGGRGNASGSSRAPISRKPRSRTPTWRGLTVWRGAI